MSTYDLYPPLKDKEAKDFKFEIVKTATGQWRTYVPPKGKKFKEFVSDFKIFGTPYIHIAIGIDPRTEKLAIAEGVIAIGQRASGIVAIGQLATGYVAIGQAAFGRVAAIGQLAIAPLALGQLSIGVLMIGQIVFGGWGIGMMGTVVDGIGMQLIEIGHLLGF